ncbi:MAG: DUF948 domain-containing protein [Candidatus Rokubacteria bacterium]|nr:DUF948 domain-containing protein [Candidatus Rokubacteria bacterium]MBI3824674.1 DUF948 domain-containing protein [Candidatus Rokubacteria bacterium]
MPFWVQVILVLCAIALTAALVPVLIALRRTAQQAERVLVSVEQELAPLAAEVRRLAAEAEALTRETRLEVERLGAITDRAGEVAEGVGRVVTALAGLTRAGQVVGVAHAIKTGIDVFVHRLRRQQGDGNHGE